MNKIDELLHQLVEEFSKFNEDFPYTYSDPQKKVMVFIANNDIAEHYHELLTAVHKFRAGMTTIAVTRFAKLMEQEGKKKPG